MHNINPKGFLTQNCLGSKSVKGFRVNGTALRDNQTQRTDIRHIDETKQCSTPLHSPFQKSGLQHLDIYLTTRIETKKRLITKE
jgi:hypothetical protein